jgi:hypothetical protein
MTTDMILYCPNCGTQHIDAPDTDAEYSVKLHESSWWELGGEKPSRWTNPPHKSHLCHGCGCIWRPADVATNGVAELKSSGKDDAWPVHNDEVRAMPALGVRQVEVQRAAAEPLVAIAEVIEADHDNAEARIRWLLNPLPLGSMLYAAGAPQEDPQS